MAALGSLTLSWEEEQQEPAGDGAQLRTQAVWPHGSRQVLVCAAAVCSRSCPGRARVEFGLGREWEGRPLGRSKEISWESRTELSALRSVQDQSQGCLSSLWQSRILLSVLSVKATAVRIDHMQ